MSASVGKTLAPVVLVFGDDDFTVKRRAREIYQGWGEQLGGADHEIIDAQAGNSSEAVKAVAKLREALQTLPFFGTGKAIWFQGCNFLADERTAGSQAVVEFLIELAQELKAFDWKMVRLVISAIRVDRRKVFFKTLEKIGSVESYNGLSIDDRDWVAQAESVALERLRACGKQVSEEALSELVATVGPSVRQLGNEIEKLLVYAGDRTEITVGDVAAITTRNKQARAFALADALGDRDLPRALHCLDEELWVMKFDRQKSEVGLLYGLISKMRMLILLKEMLGAGWLKPERDYNRFKRQLEHVPAGALPDDKRFNPLAMNPYVLFKAHSQAANYSANELVRAMDLLLQCNQQLFSNTDQRTMLQRTLVQIVRSTEELSSSAASGRNEVRSSGR